MGAYSTKPRFQRILAPALTFLVSHHVHPDVLTCGAVGLCILAGAALTFAGSAPVLLFITPPAVLLRLTFNLLDGMLAREIEVAGPWGEIKNEFGDRVADAAVFVGIGIGGYASPHLALLTMVIILLTPYLGLLSKAVGGSREYGGIMGKPDRMLTLAIFVLYPVLTGDLESFNYYLGFVLIACLITLGQRMVKIYERAQSLG
jgi:CDP-diacylglycerol--glycerol-3-phosphate 3-phosphatidyltransferase